jgi:hypothetical protein
MRKRTTRQVRIAIALGALIFVVLMLFLVNQAGLRGLGLFGSHG